MRTVILLVAMLFTVPAGICAPKLQGSESFTNLFAQTCMANFYSQEKLRSDMAAQGSPVLAAEHSQPFMGGATGTAWGVVVEESAYIVVLRDDNVCAVYAQHAPVGEVRKNFMALYSSGPPLLVVEKMDDISSGPDADPSTTTAYSWSRAGDKEKLVFTLTTSSGESSGIQASATMSLAN